MISIFTSSHFINFPPTLPYAYAANKSPLITVSLKFCYQITANIRGSSSLLSFSVVSDPFTISYSYTYPIGLLCHTVSWLCSLHVMPSQSHLLSLPHFSLFHFQNFCSPEQKLSPQLPPGHQRTNRQVNLPTCFSPPLVQIFPLRSITHVFKLVFVVKCKNTVKDPSNLEGTRHFRR